MDPLTSNERSHAIICFPPSVHLLYRLPVFWLGTCDVYALLSSRQILAELHRQQDLHFLGDDAGDHNAQDEFQ